MIFDTNVGLLVAAASVRLGTLKSLAETESSLDFSEGLSISSKRSLCIPEDEVPDMTDQGVK